MVGERNRKCILANKNGIFDNYLNISTIFMTVHNNTNSISANADAIRENAADFTNHLNATVDSLTESIRHFRRQNLCAQ